MEKIKILFLQLEIIPDCPPHMGMCLFIDDLEKKGVHCDTYIVQADYIKETIPLIQKGNYDLICLDSVFTINMINFFQEQFPSIPILIGGINAIALLFHTNVQYAVFGPGREAISAFINQYFGDQDLYKVPNLFFKHGNHISYSGKTLHWNLERELFPYLPFLDWQYIGHHRNPDASFNDISIVAGTGCPYARSTVSSHHFNIKGTIQELGYTLSDRALQRLEEIFNSGRHGCSFCIFQYQEVTHFSVEKTTELLLKQATYLHETHNVTSFQIQTENPLPFLDSFLSALIEKQIPFHKISLRTRPDLLLLHRDKLLKALDLARKKDFCLSIEQIGFESFYNNDLVIFNKNVSVENNITVLNFLRTVKHEYGKHVVVDIGHGILLFHPWTTLQSITENLKVLVQYRDIFPSFFASNLILYSEFFPIFPEIRMENLFQKSKYYYGYEYIMKDPLASKAFELYQILHSHFGGNISLEAYLKSMEMIKDYSVDEILAQVFYLIPVPED
ncbi:MAG: cobalamin B12-binding domain-containing protein [Nitrospira sp.]|nr:cobalamin B12-binding domain-containing protein [Nitrospira sp.]